MGLADIGPPPRTTKRVVTNACLLLTQLLAELTYASNNMDVSCTLILKSSTNISLNSNLEKHMVIGKMKG